MNLDLSGATGLQLTTRLPPADQATLIQVLLFDADGTILRFDYPTSAFNTSTFSPAIVGFNLARTVVAGSIPGFNLADVTTYEVQGNFFDPGGRGNALFSAQFDGLSTVGTPEPSTAWLCALATMMLAYWICRKRQPRGCR